MIWKVCLTVITLACLCFPQVATAQGNLVVNGGFEAGSQGWTFNKWVGVSAGGDPGIFALLYNDDLSDPTVPTASQIVGGLTAGDSYIISGDYLPWKNQATGSPLEPSFGVAVNGVFLFETVAPASYNWQSFSFSYTAISSSALLSLSSQINGMEISYGIDNIAMQAVPEPSSSLLIMLGSGVVIYVRRRDIH